jgi:hypothetical protein
MPFLQSNYATSALSLLVPDTVFHSRGANAPEFCQSQGHEKPFARKATRVLKWSAGRRRGRGPRHADGCCHPPTLRAWRAPQDNPLARTACFGRAAPPGAPPPSRSSAAAVDRRRLRAAFRSCQPESPAGVLLSELTRCVTKRGTRCQGLNSCGRRVG